jgi:hypothetical protein
MTTFNVDQPVNSGFAALVENLTGAQIVYTPPAPPSAATEIQQVALSPTNPANASANGLTCISPYQMMTRRQYRNYTGPLVIGTGGYVYCLSDTVPANRYWALFYCDILPGKGVGITGDGLALWVIPPGTKLPTLAPGNNPNDTFFADYRALGGGRNDGPPIQGVRIDDQNTPNTGTVVMSEAQAMIRNRKYVLLAPGETLLGFALSGGTPESAGSFIEMRIAFTELLSGETFDL